MSSLRVPWEWLVPVVEAVQQQYPWLSKTRVRKQARDLIIDQRSGVNTHEEWVDMWTRLPGQPPFNPLEWMSKDLLLPGQPPFKKPSSKKPSKKQSKPSSKKQSKPSSRDDPIEEDPIEDCSEAIDDDPIDDCSEDAESKEDDDAYYKLWSGVLRSHEDDRTDDDKSQAETARKKARTEA